MMESVSRGTLVDVLEKLMGNVIQEGLPRDFNRAKEWILEPRSLQDRQRAVGHLRSVIDHGMTDAIPWLAFCYERGFGVEKDMSVARCLYRLSRLEGSNEEENLPKDRIVSSTDRGVIRVGVPQYEVLDDEALKPLADDLYFDIETAGLESGAEITAICWFFRGDAKFWHYSGIESRPEEFISDFASAGRVVTYNGDSFDLPRINAKWNIAYPKVSIDLRHYLGRYPDLKCHKMKYVAQELGLPFYFDKDFNGAEAIYEWHKIRNACAPSNMWDDAYFSRLVKYCLHDVYLTRSLHYFISGENVPHDGILEAKMDSIVTYAFYEPELPSGYTPLFKDVPTKYKDRWTYTRAYPFKTLASSIVVITGEGRKIARPFAEDITTKLGAKLKASKPTRDTDFCVVLGVEDVSNIQYETGKLCRAKELQGQGSPIRILNENQFIELIEASLKESGGASSSTSVKSEGQEVVCTLSDEFERLWNAILADGVIEPSEVEAIRCWISKNDLNDGPFLDMITLMDKIVADGVVTYDEEMDLYNCATTCLKELEGKKKGQTPVVE